MLLYEPIIGLDRWWIILDLSIYICKMCKNNFSIRQCMWEILKGREKSPSFTAFLMRNFDLESHLNYIIFPKGKELNIHTNVVFNLSFYGVILYFVKLSHLCLYTIYFVNSMSQNFVLFYRYTAIKILNIAAFL